MKLSSNFNMYGLNLKTVQNYLKEQAKTARGVRVFNSGDVVYILSSYAAFKFLPYFYGDIAQPVTLRECPAIGQTIVSGQFGFEVEKNAPNLPDIFDKAAARAEKTAQRTPFLQDLPTGKKKSSLARLFHVGPVPILINSQYDSMVDPAQFTYFNTGSSVSPIYAANDRDPAKASVSVIMLPIRPSADVEALCKKMFSE